MTLINGQYQIGNLVMGRGTRYQIADMTATGYGATPGDVPLPRSDEIRFRKDYLQPGQLQFTVQILDNYNIDGSPDTYEKSDDMLEKLMKEWRADEVRQFWGYVKPITYRQNDSTRIIVGRPRDIASSVRQRRPGAYACTLAFQRVDTVTYDEFNNEVSIAVSETKQLVRSGGEANTWMEIYITGPVNIPSVAIGPYLIYLQKYIAPGEVVQINSYPWERRAVSSSGENVANDLVGSSPYLDELKIPPGVDWPVYLAGGGNLDANTKVQVFWREAYNAL